jgi:hypothetical protein
VLGAPAAIHHTSRPLPLPLVKTPAAGLQLQVLVIVSLSPSQVLVICQCPARSLPLSVTTGQITRPIPNGSQRSQSYQTEVLDIKTDKLLLSIPVWYHIIRQNVSTHVIVKF